MYQNDHISPDTERGMYIKTIKYLIGQHIPIHFKAVIIKSANLRIIYFIKKINIKPTSNTLILLLIH